MKRTSKKIRKSWGQVKPWTQPHGGKRGARGYDRKAMRREDQEIVKEFLCDN